MPLYEYYCASCNGVFELLHPVREAAEPQPCPECDADAKRILSKAWGAFIDRDGTPRRLPDRGKYWNLFEESDTPLTTSNVEAPEARPRYVKQRTLEGAAADRTAVSSGPTPTAPQSQAGEGVVKVRRRRAKDGP